jgi:Ring finger domain
MNHRKIFNALRVFLLLVLLTNITAQAPPPPDLRITIMDGLKSSYPAQIANFGNKFSNSPSFDTILMFPPDEKSLCRLPLSLENMTKEIAANLTSSFGMKPISLLVSRGECPFDTKAKVVLQMQERFTPLLRCLIVYNNNSSQPDDLLVMLSNGSHFDLGGINAAFMSTNAGYSMVSQVQVHALKEKISPYFLNQNSRGWDMHVRVEVLSSENSGGRSTSAEAFYWLRFVLFSLLIVSPCVRVGYLWYTAGGRFMVRRNETGRFTGIQYVRPMPFWFTTGLEARDEEEPKSVLTYEQVLALPELVFKVQDHADAMTLDDGLGTENVADADGLDLNPSNLPTDHNLENALNRSTLSSLLDVNVAAVDAASTQQTALSTTCTTCSICIDEFEDGERIRLLPNCKHAFHLDCIKPWLTERQSCCPLCKTEALPKTEVQAELKKNPDLPA